jgi:uncharacterized integral membrane protein
MAENPPQQAATPESAHHGELQPTKAARAWVSIGIAAVLLILLIIFIAQNSEDVTVSFLGIHVTIALGLAILIAAVVGAIVALLAGTARIWQLRREVKSVRAAHEAQRLQQG